MINPKQKLRLKREMMDEKPMVLIGKNGVTQGVVEEVSRKLDKNEIVKIKVLKSGLKAAGREEVAEEVSRLTESTLVETRGHTIILFRKRKR